MVEDVGPANCQLPPLQFSGLSPSSKVRAASPKSPHPCSHLPYYTGLQEASLWETRNLSSPEPRGRKNLPKRKEGRQWKHGSGRLILRERLDRGGEHQAHLSPLESDLGKSLTFIFSDRRPSQPSTHCYTVRPLSCPPPLQVLIYLIDKARPSSSSVLEPHFKGKGGTTRNGSHCRWVAPEVSAEWSNGPPGSTLKCPIHTSAGHPAH